MLLKTEFMQGIQLILITNPARFEKYLALFWGFDNIHSVRNFYFFTKNRMMFLKEMLIK